MLVKAQSVQPDGTPDGWEPPTAWRSESTEQGQRLVISVGWERLADVHLALIAALGTPIGVLYRRKVDRRDPKPEGWPGQDLIALDVPGDRLAPAVSQAADLFYGDARCELWLRGPGGTQLVLDQDGVIYAYPDNAEFRAALHAAQIPDGAEQTLAQRDYVKHWFRADADAQEEAFVQGLNLTEWG